ncbi:hypothetical protein [Streptomyces sp. NPDC047315]
MTVLTWICIALGLWVGGLALIFRVVPALVVLVYHLVHRVRGRHAR